MLGVVQVAINSADLAGTFRLYSEAFGFRNAGGQCNWGEVMRVQGLPTDSRGLIWWLTGGQPFFQLEIFNHSRPAQRPLPADWRPSDHGWTRFGVAIADFDACLTAFERHGAQPIAVTGAAGSRRAGIRDPYAGIVIEIVEDAGLRDGPAVTYATSSVSDLPSARTFYGDVLGFEILPLDRLHSPEDEALWGLPAARRDGFVAKGAGDVLIEVLCYSAPQGRPKPDDYLISDQGIMNLALGSRSVDEVSATLDRLALEGLVPPFVVRSGSNICGYILDRERELEFAGYPEGADDLYGFAPARIDFFGAAIG